MWITTSLMSFGTVVLLATLFPLSSSLAYSQSEVIELLKSNFTRPKRQLFREDIPHHRPLSGNHYARHHGFPHPGRWTNRPSMPVPVRPAESDDDFGNSIDSNFHGGNNYHQGINNYGSHLHTVDPTTVTIHNDIIHDDDHGHGGGNYGHGHGHAHPHPPPPPPPPPHHEEPSYGVGGGYGGGEGGYGNGPGGYVEYGRGHESGRYGHGTGGGYQGDAGGVEVGHNNANGGPHKTVVHYHPVQFGNYLPVGESEGVTYSPQNGYGPQGSGPEVSTGFGGGYSSGPSHSEHHGGDSASYTDSGNGSPHFQHHPHPPQPHRHYPPGKEPIGVPIAIPVITHFHQSRPRRPKIAFGSHHHGGVKFPTYIVHGHKPRRRPYFSFRRPNKARWIVNLGH